jgi:dimethylhistidine N-methyltransferase
MNATVQLHQLPLPNGESLRDEVLAGFARTPKAVSPKHFYDQRGSELFEQICQQPEYYPTRTEEQILARIAPEVAEIAGPQANLVELGSGASRKVRLLLEALRPASYLGIDISRDFLWHSTQRLARDYPWLEVHAACADYSQPMQLPGDFTRRQPLLFFPGSSIGNLTPDQARVFLGNVRQWLPDTGGLLIGVDLLKPQARLEAAYNDQAGVTAAFNLNLLHRIRRELDADIDPSAFSHQAFFNPDQSRIEMHLVSRQAQQVRIEDRHFHFAAGESLHTENSYKYSAQGFQALAAEAGFQGVALWTDAEHLFSVHYLQRA